MSGVLHLSLLLALFVSSALLGSFLSSEDRRRVEALSELLRLIAYIRVSVEYYGMSTEEIFSTFRSKELERTGFLAALSEWGERDGIFSEGLMQYSRELGLDGLLDQLIPFGDRLGHLMPGELRDACLGAEELISAELERRREELPKKMKLHRAICTAFGMMAVLLLL